MIGTFTSDEEGVVTTLYGFKEDDVYTITEKKSPTGFVALKGPITFKIAVEDSKYKLSDWTNGNDTDDDTDTTDGKNWAEYITDDTVYNAVIDLYNPEFVLKAVKVDSKDKSMVLAGVHFELHRQVVSSVTGASMDTNPMTGYEDLVSDENGIIAGINSQLPPGVYYLVETKALEGYQMMELQDAIQFRITDDGDVEMVREDQRDLLTVEEGTYQMTISVPNTRDFVTLTVTKTVKGSLGDKTAAFDFTVKAGSPDSYTSYTEVEYTDDPEIKEGEMLNFSISHGESFTLKVPSGVDVIVTEDNKNYSTTMQAGDEGKTSGPSCTLNLNEDTELAVTNTLGGIIPTGIYLSLQLMILLFSVIVFGVVFFAIRLRKGYTE